MAVSKLFTNWFGFEDMPDSKSVTISIRVPRSIGEWVMANGGSNIVRAALYGHIFSSAAHELSEQRVKMLTALIEEAAIEAIPQAPPDFDELAPSLRME